MAAGLFVLGLLVLVPVRAIRVVDDANNSAALQVKLELRSFSNQSRRHLAAPTALQALLAGADLQGAAAVAESLRNASVEGMDFEPRVVPAEWQAEIHSVEARMQNQSTADKADSLSGLATELLIDIGSGTGALVSGTGSAAMDKELVRRVGHQNKVVFLMVLLAYMGSLALSASLVYRQACNSSAVKYYADPRFHAASAETHELDDFLEAFNQPPRDAHLQVMGLVPLSMFPTSGNVVEWLGSPYRVAFSFALDLSPWLARSSAQADAEQEVDGGASAGLDASDLDLLRTFLREDSNDLAMIEMVKEVFWKDWEELATNIKQRIRQSGFQGIISVKRGEREVMTVHKNRPWANFMHSRTTKVLSILSIVGWLLYVPYMWIRNRSMTVTSRFCVQVSIGAYWSLIADKLSAEGFEASVS